MWCAACQCFFFFKEGIKKSCLNRLRIPQRRSQMQETRRAEAADAARGANPPLSQMAPSTTAQNSFKHKLRFLSCGEDSAQTRLSDESTTCRLVGGGPALFDRSLFWSDVLLCDSSCSTLRHLRRRSLLAFCQSHTWGDLSIPEPAHQPGLLINQSSKLLYQDCNLVSQLECFANPFNLSHVSGEEEFKESLWGKVRPWICSHCLHWVATVQGCSRLDQWRLSWPFESRAQASKPNVVFFPKASKNVFSLVEILTYIGLLLMWKDHLIWQNPPMSWDCWLDSQLLCFFHLCRLQLFFSILSQIKGD